MGVLAIGSFYEVRSASILNYHQLLSKIIRINGKSHFDQFLLHPSLRIHCYDNDATPLSVFNGTIQ